METDSAGHQGYTIVAQGVLMATCGPVVSRIRGMDHFRTMGTCTMGAHHSEIRGSAATLPCRLFPLTGVVYYRRLELHPSPPRNQLNWHGNNWAPVQSQGALPLPLARSQKLRAIPLLPRFLHLYMSLFCAQSNARTKKIIFIGLLVRAENCPSLFIRPGN